MTRAMAVELSPSGIRVNCLASGFIRTDMSASAVDSLPAVRQFNSTPNTGPQSQA